MNRHPKTIKTGKPLLLLTNDDGYFSPGIQVLAARLRKFADTFIVAPDRERSANSLSLTLRRPLRINKIRLRVFAIDGTPADCIYLALKKLLPRKPDLILSGMNLGPNLGRQDIAYSGTVAAAIQGTFLNIPSVALSLSPIRRGQFALEPSARFAEETVRRLLKTGLPEGVLLNINIPAPPIKGVKITCLGERKYNPQIIEKRDPNDDVYYWIGAGNPKPTGDRKSDVRAAERGFISITPLHLDLTAHELMAARFLKTLCLPPAEVGA